MSSYAGCSKRPKSSAISCRDVAEEDLGLDLRSFSFRRNYVVIYRPLADGIDVLRVFHTARDYGRLFHAGE